MPVYQPLIEQIHSAGKPMVLAVTGGGSGALSELLQVPGASASVLAAVVPYSKNALREWLGGTPDQACSERTARAMAMAAFERARAISEADPRTLRGIGVTASLATNRPKRGPHRVHVAWQSAEATVVASLELVKGARTRAVEESIATEMALAAAAEACGISGELPRLDRLGPQEAVSVRRVTAPSTWSQLLLGETAAVLNLKVNADHTGWVDVAQQTKMNSPVVLFPGAFNPLHEGHERMAAIAVERLGAPVTWDLSVTNVDKPPLDFLEIRDRLSQFSGRRVMLSRVATFAEKSEFAPGCTFVVGTDTMARVAAPRYYENDVTRRDLAVRTLIDRGCRFLVFGRVEGQTFRGLDDLALPKSVRDLCNEVPESEFRLDVASSQIRAG
jgi:nicotinamide mononucleotide (NMN) deamidase PncC